MEVCLHPVFIADDIQHGVADPLHILNDFVARRPPLDRQVSYRYAGASEPVRQVRPKPHQ